MDEVVAEFLGRELRELDRLEPGPGGPGAEPAADKLAGIFRTIHTIKGTSGFLATGNWRRSPTSGRNLLSRLRDGELALDADTRRGCWPSSTGSAGSWPVEADGTEGDAELVGAGRTGWLG